MPNGPRPRRMRDWCGPTADVTRHVSSVDDNAHEHNFVLASAPSCYRTKAAFCEAAAERPRADGRFSHKYSGHARYSGWCAKRVRRGAAGVVVLDSSGPEDGKQQDVIDVLHDARVARKTLCCSVFIAIEKGRQCETGAGQPLDRSVMNICGAERGLGQLTCMVRWDLRANAGFYFCALRSVPASCAAQFS
ncbi:hypothetical protein FVE85_2374 [Porphyridium purpureum]|uniref:Uncharacterized protein n=1 Tax=Porphyridium purpureum TaxID=35688 RepID=A0A5J4YXB2_PORPP|nr:hypothetical protein FVE85_2374 [Porphyridium purpureum]|eukprot:POR9586..scf209_3